MKQELEKQKLHYQNLEDSMEDESLLKDPYSFLEEETLLKCINELAEDVLTAKEKKVLHLRFSDNLTQEEVAKKLQISQQAVSKHENQAYRKLRMGVTEFRTSKNIPSKP